MKSRKYNNKEIAVFDGLFTLLKQGKNLYNIKVSEIAKAANIGKGTIYDYFDSKEEAIYMALLYYINNEMTQILKEIEKIQPFKEKIYKLFEIIEQNIEGKYSTIKTLLSAGDIETMYNIFEEDENLIDLFMDYMAKISSNIISSGEKEGNINIEHSYYYKRSAIKCILIEFASYVSHKDCYSDVTTDMAKDVAYTQLIKMLR
ncbi:MAG: TetR/AcrR family transcriptional regulator [Tissierellales bacterium]|nr:TetR/AcrR family transcriptional regulator [Tissierellales bacterium]